MVFNMCVHAYVHDTTPPQAAMHASRSFIEIQQQAIDLQTKICLSVGFLVA